MSLQRPIAPLCTLAVDTVLNRGYEQFIGLPYPRHRVRAERALPLVSKG